VYFLIDELHVFFKNLTFSQNDMNENSANIYSKYLKER